MLLLGFFSLLEAMGVHVTALIAGLGVGAVEVPMSTVGPWDFGPMARERAPWWDSAVTSKTATSIAPSTGDYTLQWALTCRAGLAMLFGLSEGAMLLFAFWLPRITAALMATFFTGFALLDGLVALFAAAWGFRRGARRPLLACEGLTGVAAGMAVVFRAPGQRPGPLVIFAWWAIVTGLLQAAEALSPGAHRRRPFLAATAVLSVAFGGLILGQPPQDLMTLTVYLAAYGLLLGVLRLIVAIRLQTPGLV